MKGPPVFRPCDGPKAKGRPQIVIQLTSDSGPPARKAMPVPKAGSAPGVLPKSRLPENTAWAQTAPWDLYDPPQGFPYLGIERSEWPTLLESLHKRTPHAVGFKTKMPKPREFTDNRSRAAEGIEPKKAFYLRILGQGHGQTNPVYDAPPFEGRTLIKKLPCGLVLGPIGDVTHIEEGYVTREDGRRTWHPEYFTAAVPNFLREEPAHHALYENSTGVKQPDVVYLNMYCSHDHQRKKRTHVWVENRTMFVDVLTYDETFEKQGNCQKEPNLYSLYRQFLPQSQNMKEAGSRPLRHEPDWPSAFDQADRSNTAQSSRAQSLN